MMVQFQVNRPSYLDMMTLVGGQAWSLESGLRQVPICDERPMEFDNSNAGREARI